MPKENPTPETETTPESPTHTKEDLSENPTPETETTPGSPTDTEEDLSADFAAQVIKNINLPDKTRNNVLAAVIDFAKNSEPGINEKNIIMILNHHYFNDPEPIQTLDVED